MSLANEIAGLTLEQRAILETRLKDRRAAKRPTESIPRRQQRERARLSFGQQRLWFLDQLEPGNVSYNIPAAFRLRGPLNTAALQRSLNEVVRRHEILRTSFAADSKGPFQIIQPALDLTLPITDLRRLVSAQREAAVRELSVSAAREPFDMKQAPLLRVSLLRLADEDWVLLYTMHHIVSDAWSLGLLAREVTQLYTAYAMGQRSTLPELPVQYGDFAEWQRERWEQGRYAAHLAYWKATLENVAPELQLPANFSRPPVLSYSGARQAVAISPELTTRLELLSRETDVTLFMTLLAAWQLLLHRYTGQDDIVIGSDFAGRSLLETEGLIGFFINTLLLRTEMSGNPTFRALVARVRSVCLSAFQHQEAPFDRIVEELQPERSLSRNPLFQVAFTLQTTQASGPGFPGLELTSMEVESERTQFDLCLNLQQKGHSIQGYLEYSTDLFASETIAQLAHHFQNLLTAIVTRPDDRILNLPLLDERERRVLVDEWSSAKVLECDRVPFPKLFEAQVERRPQATAVTFRGERLTYHELNERANRVAAKLIAEGVKCDDVVALLAERGFHLLTGMLAIFKAGAAYLPLDLHHPPRRNSKLLEQSGVTLLLSTSDLVPALQSELPESGPRLLSIDELVTQEFPRSNPPVARALNSLAYVIYTSGSTGIPKGAMVEQRGMLNHLRAKITSLALNENDKVAQTASQCFDISVWQFLSPLLVGGCVEVIDDEAAQDPEQLLEKVEAQGITILEVVPSLLRVMLDSPRVKSSRLPLRRLLVTGEALPPDLCRSWLTTNIPLVNAYGPTECSDDVTQHEISTPPPGNAINVPIGRPIINTRLYILDTQMQPVPRGVAGQLCIGGVCVGRGYLGDPSRTAEAFIPDPFSSVPGERLYQCGDLVRYLSDRTIEFLGRLDHQVKIRGFRIELGEIEAALRLHEQLTDCAVVARTDKPNAPRLVAYVVLGDSSTRHDEASGLLLDDQKVAQWNEVFDEVYDADTYSTIDPSLNRRVWISSYSGDPLSEEEVFECLEGTVERLAALKPRHVLEIGCGTGLILFRLSPQCDSYCGTDLSPAALRVIQRRLQEESNHDLAVELFNCPADVLPPVGERKFDTVIINEVVQYFPSTDYLARVLEAALEMAAPDGRIFVGGVRSFPLFETFHTSLQLFQAEPTLSLAQLRRRISKHMRREKELLVSAEFFTAFQRLHDRIGYVEVQLRPGRLLNELNKFRNDVILHLGNAARPAEAFASLEWQGRETTLASVRRELIESSPEMLCISGLPNGRLLEDQLAVELLAAPGEMETVGQLREAVAQASARFETVDPDEMRALAADLDYAVEVCWSRGGDQKKFDAVFRRGKDRRRITAVFAQHQNGQPRDWSRYGNNPAEQKAGEQLFRDLREYLKEQLPDYMVPTSFVALDRLPLTQNGKLDRRRLPEPETVDGDQYQAPLTPMEQVVQGVWSEVLGLDRVGVRDNFFDLGGHSLLATQVMSRLRDMLGVELPLRTLFESPTITGLARAAQEAFAAGKLAAPPITPAGRNAELPLSFAQQRLWFLYQLEPDTPVYNLPLAYRLTGSLDTVALESSFRAMVHRHESLRTNFLSDGGNPRQVISKAEEWQLESIDLRQTPAPERKAEVERLIDANGRQPFDLANESLFRARLLRLAEEEYMLLVALHHVIADGWSIGLLLKETAALYRSHSHRQQSTLAELPIQYADYAVWQREWLGGSVLAEQLAYWKEQLAGAPPTLDLPIDKPRPAVPTTNGARVHLTLSAELTQQLRELSRKENATLFMTMLAAFQTLLYRYTGQDDVVVGSPIAGRTRPEIEGIIGFFINTIVLRTDLSGSPSFVELLKRVRRVCLEAYANQDVPFERLVEELQPVRDLSHSPLFQVLFAFDAVPAEKYELEELQIEEIEVDSGATNFDLTLTFEDKGDRLAGVLGYKTDLFEAATMERLVQRLEMILHAVVANPVQEISRLNILSESEPDELLGWSGTQVSHEARCFHELFAELSGRNPDRIAVVFRDEQISYRELNRKAGQVSDYLRRNGVGPDSCVGVMCERSIGMVVALLGVLKAGAAYLPLDPAIAPERLRFVVEDAGVEIVLTNETLAAAYEIKEENSSQSVLTLPANLAYVIYTSGSTGEPKGVMVQHSSILNLLNGLEHSVYSVAGHRPERASLNAPLSFDASVQQLLLLLCGVTLVVVPDEIRTDGPALLSYLAEHDVRIFDCTPSQLNVLLDAALLTSGAASPNLFLVAGEAMDQRLWDLLAAARGREFFNIYGPTECTVDITARRVAGATGLPTIGRPLANSEVLLLNTHMQLAPVGIAGELYVGGNNVARGYLNRPDLTAERFLPHPFSAEPGGRLYRTGDRGRYRDDGEIEFLGRVDQQIKIRGYRIEPAEIETVLRQDDSIQDAVVVARETGSNDRRLVAYIVPVHGPASPATLRTYLRKHLPDYMVPSLFVSLDRLPLTRSGKVDRRALPEPGEAKTSDLHPLARTPVEQAIAAVWAKVLGVEMVGPHDNFFELGGHSLLATQVISRVCEIFNVELPLRSLFETSSLAAFADLVENALKEDAGLVDSPIERVPRDGPLPLSFAQERLWFIQQLEPGTAVNNIPLGLRLGGRLDTPALKRSLRELVRRHDILRTRFLASPDGPRQQVDESEIELPILDLSAVTAHAREDELQSLATAEARRPFNLSEENPFRLLLVRLDEHEHVLLGTIHHIASDAWSLGVIIRELALLYEAFLNGRTVLLEELTVQYADYAVWQKERLQGEVLERQLAYWRQQLNNAPRAFDLPTDRPRPPVQTFRGATEPFILPVDLAKGLKDLSHRENATLFMVLLSAFCVLLYKYTEQEDIVIGTGIANRGRLELESLIGCFFNILALRTRPSGDLTFQALLGQVRETTLAAYAHQDVPFEMVLNGLQLPRDQARTPLFSVMFAFQNAQQQAIELPGLTVSSLALGNTVAKFDLTVFMEEDAGTLVGEWEYNLDLFDHYTMQSMLKHWQNLLQDIVADPEKSIKDITLASVSDDDTSVYAFNDELDS